MSVVEVVDRLDEDEGISWYSNEADQEIGSASVALRLTDRVEVFLQVLPEARVAAVAVEFGNGAPSHRDRDLAMRILAGGPELVHEIMRTVVAIEAASSSRWWTVVCAETAAQLSDMLGIEESDCTGAGLRTLWRNIGVAAALALFEIPDCAKEAGGNALRSLVVPLLRRWSESPPRKFLHEELNENLAAWPISQEDLPEPGDDTIGRVIESETEGAVEVPAGRGPVFLGTPSFRGAVPRGSEVFRLEVLVPDLVAHGLVAPDVTAKLTREDDGFTWRVEVEIRPEVCQRLAELRIAADTASQSPEDPELLAAFIRCDAAFQIECDTPESTDDRVRELNMRDRFPPALPDVVAVVPRDGYFAEFTLREVAGDTSSEALALACHIPLPRDTDPVSAGVHLEVRRPDAPNRKLADRLLAAFARMYEGAYASAGEQFRDLASHHRRNGETLEAASSYRWAECCLARAEPGKAMGKLLREVSEAAQEMDPGGRLRPDAEIARCQLAQDGFELYRGIEARQRDLLGQALEEPDTPTATIRELVDGLRRIREYLRTWPSE